MNETQQISGFVRTFKSYSEIPDILESECKNGNSAAKLFYSWLLEEEERRENLIKSLMCSYCGKLFKKNHTVNKHEDKCKIKPINKYDDFIKTIGGEKYFGDSARLGISVCITVNRKWNDYQTYEFLRPNGDIEIWLDPYNFSTNEKQINKNEEHIRLYKKPLPFFRGDNIVCIKH